MAASIGALIGCASGGLVDKGLEFVGVKPPENLAAAKESAEAARQEAARLLRDRTVTIRIHAGQVLNTDGAGRSLSVVTRIYRLKASSQFAQAPYAAFAAPEAAPSVFAADVVSMNEIVLTPGQRYEVVETLPAEATQLAVVALFRAPDDKRWRFVFDARAAAKTGITLGVHACALSVAEGAPLAASPDVLRLAGARCSS